MLILCVVLVLNLYAFSLTEVVPHNILANAFKNTSCVKACSYKII